MITFNDTKLLRHPTVEKAFEVMRSFLGMDDDALALSAAGPGELITQYAKNPLPDAVAAAVLMDGMIAQYEAAQFADMVSPGAAECLAKMQKMDMDKPAPQTPAEQQVLLAYSIRGLEQVYDAIRAEYLDYDLVKGALKTNEKSLLRLMQDTSEPEMAEIALGKFIRARDALDIIVTEKQASLIFEKSGLPDHPTVRGVYKYMRSWNLASHPMGGYCETNRDIAKTLFNAGVQDPEMIAAALLNQYSGKADLATKFSPRIADLYAETSAWASLGSSKPKPQPTPDGQTIRHAARLRFLGNMLDSYAGYTARKRFDNTQAVMMLERIEDMRDSLSNGIHTEQAPGLKRNMQYIVSQADALLHMPKNAKIRKPGSPKLDPGW